MNYDVVIGLEVHAELSTKTKIYCSCENTFGAEVNSKCCPICTGMPGTLPSLNEKVVEYAVKAGHAFNCTINPVSKQDRKNYFYPDLPKAWQTSQHDLPLCKSGNVEYFINGVKKSVRINRIHLEEDAGKLIHENDITRIDYNRCGVPLIEIVTEPDFHSPEEVVAFLEELKSILKYTGVSEVKMQEGNLRVDVNLSVAPVGALLGTRTETKNLNSFRAVLRACKWEANRQIELLSRGEEVIQETRRWDDAQNKGYAMRSKEDAHDYRFFPEPDLLPVFLDEPYIEKIRASIPPLKRERIEKYIKFGLSERDAEILTCDMEISDLYDRTIELGADKKRTANFIMSDVLRLAKEQNKEDLSVKITPEQLYLSIDAIEKEEVSLAIFQKEVFPRLWGTNDNPILLIEKLGFKQSSNITEIEEIVLAVLTKNERVVNEYKNGNEKVFAYLVGQTMKESKGKANPKVVTEVLKKLISE